MNVGIGTVAVQFFFWEYLFRIFGIVSLQCGEDEGCKPTPTISYHYVQSCVVYTPAERADTLPLFLLYPYMYSVVHARITMYFELVCESVCFRARKYLYSRKYVCAQNCCILVHARK
jgi:hypothetical protein